MIPVGAIIMWNGENIPDNWHLCDGTNGTPDLRDKFIVGSGASYAVGNTGGENTHTLTLDEIPEHEHNLTLAKTVSSNNNYNDISTMAIKQGTNLCTLESLKASGVSTSSLPISSEENGMGTKIDRHTMLWRSLCTLVQLYKLRIRFNALKTNSNSLHSRKALF